MVDTQTHTESLHEKRIRGRFIVTLQEWDIRYLKLRRANSHVRPQRDYGG